MANKDVQEYGYDIGPFPHDKPQERWHRLWNTYQWRRSKKFFTVEGRAVAAKRGHVNATLTRPWYMQEADGQDVEGLGDYVQPDAAEDEPPFPIYPMTWTNMGAIDEKDGLMTESTVTFPEFYKFDEFDEFKLHIAMVFQLHDRNLKIGELLFEVEDGPQASLTRTKVAVCSENLVSYQLEGYTMKFFLISEPLKQVDLDLMVEKTTIPPASTRRYQHAHDGLDAVDQDEAFDDVKRIKTGDTVPGVANDVPKAANVIPELEKHHYKNEAILRRADELSNTGKVSVQGQEPDLEDDPLVVDDGKTIDLSTDDQDEWDDESNDTRDDRISEGRTWDYVDEPTSSGGEYQQTLPPPNKTPGQEVGVDEGTLHGDNVFHHGDDGELSDPYRYRGLEGPWMRKPVVRSPDSEAASSSIQQAQEEELPTEDVRQLELGAENQFRLRDSDEVAQKKSKPSEKLKTNLEKLSRLLDKYKYSEDPRRSAGFGCYHARPASRDSSSLDVMGRD
ncbi:hypothetical protein LTS07_003453 [Exophiala sideris]|uniref:ETS domain-containing protein n=1 Tax=Exophiala sideris TaxID=1016849 RepID=A0ABR0JKX5_9EURO|nr:hypothetical protein LTS07_003453 [Exophiala sideris]KAK5065911.1 hypothetical protein LTR69_003461 [Exophiala sideris]KAK5185628.1 hypothetical protein LTR44_001677 [Eurotiomycetes sp. CCFEE 6388]